METKKKKKIWKGVGIALVLIVCFVAYKGWRMYRDSKIVDLVIISQNAEAKCPKDTIFHVDRVEFKMIGIQGGSIKPSSITETIDLESYYLGETEVTQALWKTVMKYNPSTFKGDSLPVDGVNLLDCFQFVWKLDSITKKHFYIPSFMQWQYAACLGKTPTDSLKKEGIKLGQIAWFNSNSGHRTHPVKTKLPNRLGLYDMIGNVDEWTSSGSDPFFFLPGGCWKSDTLQSNVDMFNVNHGEIGTNTDGLRLAWDGKDFNPKKEK